MNSHLLHLPNEFLFSKGSTPALFIKNNDDLSFIQIRIDRQMDEVRVALTSPIFIVGLFCYVFYYLYIDSFTCAFGCSAFLCRIRFCNTLVNFFSKHHHHRVKNKEFNEHMAIYRLYLYLR
jgi:hypothetical protein